MEESRLTSILLTEDEMETISAALKHWIDSAKSESMMAGLFMAALTHKEGDDMDESTQLVDRMKESGESEGKERQRKAYGILAKLV